MRNIVLIIEYDGTNYKGWQKQKNGLAIQEVIEEAIFQITGERVHLIASGRTDTGVHALGQVACFCTEKQIPAERFASAINSKLPPDISVKKSIEAPFDFNPRFDAKQKTYVYRIYNAPQPSALERYYACHERFFLDVAKMRQEAEHLIGEHDFSSFCSANSQSISKVRRIYDIVIEEEELKEQMSIAFVSQKDFFSSDKDYPSKIIRIEVTGNGFLYNMVRIIAGTLMEIGKGNERYRMEEILKNKDRACAGPTAKPEGLFLKNVEYQIDPLKNKW